MRLVVEVTGSGLGVRAPTHLGRRVGHHVRYGSRLGPIWRVQCTGELPR